MKLKLIRMKLEFISMKLIFYALFIGNLIYVYVKESSEFQFSTNEVTFQLVLMSIEIDDLVTHECMHLLPTLKLIEIDPNKNGIYLTETEFYALLIKLVAS